MRLSGVLTLPLVALAACGPSAADVKLAHNVVYDLPFARVWNAVVEETRKRYVVVETEDAVGGELRTMWRWQAPGADAMANQSAWDGDAQNRRGGGDIANNMADKMAAVRPGLYFRAKIKVVGPPPWKVIVDGEASEVRTGLKLTAFRHGDADEPEWVQGKIDSLAAAIYGRLRQHAKVIVPKAAPAPVPDERFAGIPDGAAAMLLTKVRSAAHARDAKALRELMAPSFTWGEGVDPSADTAVTMWSADPTKLGALVKLIDGGCGMKDDTVRCPAEPEPERPGRAVFRKVDGTWRFVEYL